MVHIPPLLSGEHAMLKAPHSLFIGGEWVEPSTDAVLTVISPTTEAVFITVAEAKTSDIDRAVVAARYAFDHGPWPNSAPTDRAAFLRRLAKKIRERSDKISAAWPQEMGIVRSAAVAGVAAAANALEDYAGLAETFSFEERHTAKRGGAIGLWVREPVGVVGAIIPWNAPLTLLTHKLGPALMAGCCVVVKASPEAPTIPLMIAEMAEEIGLPPGVLNVLTSDREASEHLVRHPDVDKISFTGSSAAGRRIASICGGRMARYTLELGGKSAAVVLDDYDIEAAARGICGPAVFMTGQACSSLTRIVVTRSRHDRLVAALSACFASVRVGDPLDPATGMGPIAMKRQRDRIEDLMRQGRAEGAVLACGGGRPAHLAQGFFIEPTVFGHVGNDTTLAREEIFGPVLSVIAADDEEQAIDIANDTVYGLNNSVFTNNVDRAYHIARRLRSGTVGHNVWRTDFSLSFGGFKQSGIGREGMLEGLLPYLESKSVILEGVPSHVMGTPGGS
jgi:betaine-aldehyde dehydrogenase